MSLVFAVALAAIGQAASPDMPGPHMVGSASNVMVAVAGQMVGVDVYTPADQVGAPFPVVIIGHGFARTNDNVAGHAAHLASWGMVVVAPDFPSRFAPDHALNGRIMRELLTWARGRPVPIGALADLQRSAYVGHSAGGLAAFLAAAADPTVTAVVGLDPVDNAGAGAQAAPAITASTLVLGAVSSRCNASASADGLYAALTVPDRWFLRVASATHCDAEAPSNALCTATCGGEDAARRLLFRRYMTAHLRLVLDCEARDWGPGSAGIRADVVASRVTDLDAPGNYACLPAQDGGAAPPLPRDAGPDAGLDAGPDAAGLDAEPAGADATGDPPIGVDALPLADAAANPPDLGTPADDAGTAPIPDAGTAPIPDATSPNTLAPAESSGCGCASTGPGANLLAALLVSAMGVRARWRKR